MTSPRRQRAAILSVYSGAFSSCEPNSRLKTLRRLLQMRHEAREQAAAVGAAHDVFDVVFRMRHHAEHIAALVDDAGDRLRRAVDVGFLVDCAVGGAVAIEHPPLTLEPLHRLLI